MESEFGHGRASAFRCPPVGRRADEPDVPEFGISRKTGYKIFERYKGHGLEALTDTASRRPVRYANQLPAQIESLIVRLKREKPHWGARKIRELLIRRLAGDVRVPAKSTIHAVLDRHGLVQRMGKKRNRATGTPALRGGFTQRSLVRRLQRRVQARQPGVLLSAHRHRSCLALPAVVRGLGLNARRAGILQPSSASSRSAACQAPSAPTTACPSLHPTLCSTSPSSPSGG